MNDDAENARAALRALWAASGQLDHADSLGQEQETTYTGHNDGKGGLGGNFGSERHNEVGFSGFLETNEPTFDRGEAATKFREAWRSELTRDGKMRNRDGAGGSIADAARKTSARVAAGTEFDGQAETATRDTGRSEAVD